MEEMKMVKNYLPFRTKRFGTDTNLYCQLKLRMDSAYELAITTEPDAIFLDINLIGGEGF